MTKIARPVIIIILLGQSSRNAIYLKTRVTHMCVIHILGMKDLYHCM